MKVIENATNLRNIGDAVNEIKSSVNALHERFDELPDRFVSKEDYENGMASHDKDHKLMDTRINALEELRESATNLIIKTTFRFTVGAISIIGSILLAIAKLTGLV